MAGTLYVVATPIGNLEDITLRALRILRDAQLIAAEDTRRTARLLSRYDIHAPTTSLHEHNEAAKLTRILERLASGDHVALVSDAGTPTISDPGRRLIRAALDAGIRVEPIPGPSAILAAVAASGLDATSFLFLGFPPTRSKDRMAWFDALKQAGRPAVFFEAPHRIRRTLEEMLAQLGDIRIVAGRELTKAHEELVVGPISVALERLTLPRGEFTIVAEIGRTPEHGLPQGTSLGRSAVANRQMLGLTTDLLPVSRRADIKAFARRHGLAANQVYDLIEAARKSGE